MALAASAQIANWYQQRLAMITDPAFAEHQSPYTPDTFHQSA
jgi:hypothetical protein